jgi:hypothetical protein
MERILYPKTTQLEHVIQDKKPVHMKIIEKNTSESALGSSIVAPPEAKSKNFFHRKKQEKEIEN